LDPIAKRFGRITSKDNRVHCTDPRTGEERRYRLPSHGKVNGDGIALLDAQFFEDIRNLRYFTKEFSIADFTTFTRVIGFINDSSLSVSLF